jgi:hypothetical protein
VFLCSEVFPIFHKEEKRMYTSIVLIALAGSAAPSTLSAKAVAWESDYDAAYRQGGRDRKPLAVVFGSGPNGWESLSKEGRLSNEVHDLLLAHYVCVYIDTDKSAGRRLASTFEMGPPTGLVISDHTGEYQAFRQEGGITNDDLERQLRKYSNPERVVRRTESNVKVETRYYPSPQTYTPPTNFAPAPMSFGGFSAGRSC